ncbi:HAD family hydrolase [Streptomyces iconiensis]|uniref:HAD-IB family phosphatase n=1 Tax=Streptomyces iconiensis TaxID=1384038 RepID=A0ABT6ZRL5_9ACTN|nr:HAD-IB family phosphatase [Streptomyces iconiensis]MDJ1131706.1 HAD-IB family phosphatase [Streptomyces iconiensis]
MALPAPAVARREKRSRLHLFDLDGTLMYGSAAPVEISQQLGVEREIQELEHAFATRALAPSEFAVRACALWAELTDEVVAAAFDGAPWLEGIREVWAEIRERGEHCAVISLSPDFFVRRLLDWGVHAAHGSRWPEVPTVMASGSGKYPLHPVDPSGILTPAAKVKIARKLCAEFEVSLDDCVAYGDSMSDAELFAAVPVSVAVNADQHVRGIASHDYTGRDLREAYGLVSVVR